MWNLVVWIGLMFALVLSGTHEVVAFDTKQNAPNVSEEQRAPIVTEPGDPLADEFGEFVAERYPHEGRVGGRTVSIVLPSDEEGKGVMFDVPANLAYGFIKRLHTEGRYSDLEVVCFQFVNQVRGYPEECSEMKDAAMRGSLRGVQKLLAKGANVNARWLDGVTALLLAAGSGHIKIVKFLLDQGADANVGDKDNTTPLIVAAEQGHADIVQLLLEHGADVNHPHDKGVTPLYMASQKGYDAIVAMLLESGADVNARVEYGRTPLIVASWDGHVSVVQQLLDAGAKVDAQDDYGETAATVAAWHKHGSTVRVLLDRGAAIDQKNGQGMTLLI